MIQIKYECMMVDVYKQPRISCTKFKSLYLLLIIPDTGACCKSFTLLKSIELEQILDTLMYHAYKRYLYLMDEKYYTNGLEKWKHLVNGREILYQQIIPLICC